MALEHPSKSTLFQSLPTEPREEYLSTIQRRVRASGVKVVVLDDDPTGTQTVHGVPVLTEWSIDSLRAELQASLPAFYILTNSRSLPLAKAQALNKDIGQNLRAAAHQTGREFVVVSRSDSTLRGHFPGEVSALENGLGGAFDNWLVIPCFFEGGRYTLNNIHYVEEGKALIPAGETAFARDKVFGYRSSDLRQWVEEKSDGQIRASDVASVAIELIRSGGPKAVTHYLVGLRPRQVCVVNAASYHDLEVFVMGLLAAEAQGRRFLYRTAASFVRVRAGIEPRPPVKPEELNLRGTRGGLVVVGSYVSRTTSQIEPLLEDNRIFSVEVRVETLLDDRSRPAEVEHVSQLVNQELGEGRDVLIYTSRKLKVVGDDEANLRNGQKISASLVAIVRNLAVRPRYLLAKGGITSSDIATQGLHIKRAMVLGQILPGVPVWQPEAESRYPGMPYIVFPGNVGDVHALSDIVEALSGREI